jgi:hypothetical protein
MSSLFSKIQFFNKDKNMLPTLHVDFAIISLYLDDFISQLIDYFSILDLILPIYFLVIQNWKYLVLILKKLKKNTMPLFLIIQFQ